MKPRIPNVLASRYASHELAQLWSPEHKVILERELWLAVLKAQAEAGVAVEVRAHLRTEPRGGRGFVAGGAVAQPFHLLEWSVTRL